jgi:hypothetical protein
LNFYGHNHLSGRFVDGRNSDQPGTSRGQVRNDLIYGKLVFRINAIRIRLVSACTVRGHRQDRQDAKNAKTFLQERLAGHRFIIRPGAPGILASWENHFEIGDMWAASRARLPEPGQHRVSQLFFIFLCLTKIPVIP